MLTVSTSDRYAQAALASECAEVARTVAGRNARLNRAAFALGGLAGAGHLARNDIEIALFNAAIASGYVGKDGAEQARATIRSGLDRGILEPRDLPARDDRRARPQPDPAEIARQERTREQQRLAREAEDRAREECANRIFRQADPRPWATLAARYYREHRGLDLLDEVAGHAIRFAPAGPWEDGRAPMVLDAYRDIVTNAVVGVRRTRLDPVTGAKVDRKVLGRARGAAVKLTPDSEVGDGLVVAEGTETGIAAMMLGYRPTWALGSSGAIRTLPPLPGIACLSICAETDDGGSNAAAIEECGNRWCDAGREVLVIAPKLGADLNDAIKGACR